MRRGSSKTRLPGRIVGRWFGVIGAAAVIALGAAACSADTAAQSKSAGDEVEEITTSLVGQLEPLDESTVTKLADGGTGETEVQEGTLGDKENAGKPRIHMTIANTTDAIKLRGKTTKSATDTCVDRQASGLPKMNLPAIVQSVATNKSAESCMEGSVDMELELTYSIEGSNDVLWIYTKIPTWGDNVLMCSIIDPKTWKTKYTSDYSCTKEWQQDDGHGWNPLPKIKLWKKPTEVVNEPKKAQEILKANCQVGMTGCTYKSASQSIQSIPNERWLSYGKPQANCIPDSHAELSAGEKQEVSWKNMVGGAVTAEMNIGVVKGAIEAKYEHVASEGYEFQEEHRATVPFGKVMGFYIQLGVLHIEGDFNVTTKDANYIIPDTEFDLPLNNDYVLGNLTVHKGIVHAVAWACDASDDRSKLGAEAGPTIGIPEGAEVVESIAFN